MSKKVLEQFKEMLECVILAQESDVNIKKSKAQITALNNDIERLKKKYGVEVEKYKDMVLKYKSKLESAAVDAEQIKNDANNYMYETKNKAKEYLKSSEFKVHGMSKELLFLREQTVEVEKDLKEKTKQFNDIKGKMKDMSEA